MFNHVLLVNSCNVPGTVLTAKDNCGERDKTAGPCVNGAYSKAER